MNAFKKDDIAFCVDKELSVGGLQEKNYKIVLISSAGYIWLEEPSHSSGRIGPYIPQRFQASNN